MACVVISRQEGENGFGRFVTRDSQTGGWRRHFDLQTEESTAMKCRWRSSSLSGRLLVMFSNNRI